MEHLFPIQYSYLIPLAPLVGAMIAGFFGAKWLKGQSHWPIWLGVGFSALLSICLLTEMLKLHNGGAVEGATEHAATSLSHVQNYFTWIDAGNFKVQWGYFFDSLTATMLCVVCGIGFFITVFAAGYMKGETGYFRFFAYLGLFIFMMTNLVMGENLIMLYLGWEGVGLCSYLLIGYYYERPAAREAAKKAFLVNRVGDFGFGLGIMLSFAAFGTISYFGSGVGSNTGLLELAHNGTLTAFQQNALKWIPFLLMVGAFGKSAQFPLYVWLPDAMEGPTPVSALIHAATMVTAGVYMVARSAALFQLTPHTSNNVAMIGAFTAILAASIALVQTDIKRVLAYSTVSQLGYMFLALGVGAYWVAVFHLFTHAFFKALLFLGSGSVIHAMSGEQDMRHMGALKNKIPITHWTMWVGSVAIAGIPGLAGFFSKDEILWQAYSSPQGSKVLWLVGLATAGLTAFYMWRLMNMTFYGKSRVAPEVAAHIHESPPSMWVPLVTLAAGSVFAGWLGVPKLWAVGERFQAFERWLEPAFASAAVEAAKEGAHDASTEWILMAISVAVAITGILIARWFYHRKPELPEAIYSRVGPLHGLLYNKYYVDEIYDFLFVN